MNEKTAEDELRQYIIALDTIKKIYPYLPSPPERPLTIPTIFGKSYDENFISDYLAYILHPEKNGIGMDPLLAMLQLIGTDVEVDDPETVKIYREHPLDEYGRIDLLILMEEMYAVGIENKIFSTEGVEQTRRYVKAFERETDTYQRYFIYLTPDGSQPGAEQFKPVSYRQLLHALKSISYDWSKDVRKSVIWEDFLTHLEFYITMNKGNLIISEKAKLYIEHYQIIDDLKRAYEQDAKHIFEYIVAQIQHELSGENWKVDFKDSRFYHQIYKDGWQIGNIWVHYEFWFGLNFLARPHFQVMVDVEGKEKNRFIELFETEYPSLQNEYEQKGIVYRPPRRKNALAWKEYGIEKDIENIAKPFTLAVREFSFLTEVIDKVFEKLS